MTIAEKINNAVNGLKQKRTAIINAIKSKGVDVPNNAKFAELPEKIEEIQEARDGGFYSSIKEINDRFNFKEVLKYLSIPQCTKIGRAAFEDYSSLTKIEFPKCTHVEDRALYNCTSLTEIELPLCTYVGITAFRKCTALTKVELPSCTSVEESAFNNCTSLTKVELPSCTSVGESAFSNCTALTKVELPQCTHIGRYILSNNPSLTKIELPKCIRLPDYAFNNSFFHAIFLPKCTYTRRYVFRLCRGNIKCFFTDKLSNIHSNFLQEYQGSKITLYTPATNVENLKSLMANQQYNADKWEVLPMSEEEFKAQFLNN